MKISILTFEGFNEIDSLVAFRMLKWLRKEDWTINICCPTTEVTSMGGLKVHAHELLEESHKADAVIIGSGSLTREIIKNDAIMNRIHLDPSNQIIGAQCSGTLMAEKLGLLKNVPVCTDSMTKPWVEETGLKVLNQSIFSKNNIATAGGCLAAAYLTAWIIAKLDTLDVAITALHYFAPVGEKDDFVERALKVLKPLLKAKIDSAP